MDAAFRPPMTHHVGDILIRPITPGDVAAFRELRLEALRLHPLTFTADLAEAEIRPIDAWRDQVNSSLGDGGAVIVVADGGGPGLAGMAGVYTPPQPKLAHLGTVWGVYVREASRGRGVGGALLHACADWAREKRLAGLRLSVVEGNDAALRCYERCGFVCYGVEPVAVRWEGRLYDEVLLALRL
jgi:RimJ/RimL family protein N-acetyltransferase